jgi:hypothetical protein
MDRDDEALLTLAARLRRAATDADRPDVVAKVDEVIVLIAGEQARAGDGKAASILKFLDGLGF